MAQPVPYNRQFNFQNQQALTPAAPLPADEIDAELNAIKLTLDQLLTNMELIQRDDGALANESVARVTLNSDVDLGFGAPTVWAHNTNYKADFDTIFHESFFYKCNTTHLSDPSPLGFANDIAKWTLIADFSAAAIMGLGTMSTQNADLVTITGGAISGTTITVATPDAAGKAAPKSYVDDAISTLTTYINAQDAILAGKLSAPAGTRMTFQQTAAPTGWTKDTTHNDFALRVTSGTVGTGGSVGFATVFGKAATDSRTLIQANLPSAELSVLIGAGQGSHFHDATINFFALTGSGTGVAAGPNQTLASQTVNIVPNVLPAMVGIATLGGSNTSHTHPMDIRVTYVDVIIAQKD